MIARPNSTQVNAKKLKIMNTRRGYLRWMTMPNQEMASCSTVSIPPATCCLLSWRRVVQHPVGKSSNPSSKLAGLYLRAFAVSIGLCKYEVLWTGFLTPEQPDSAGLDFIREVQGSYSNNQMSLQCVAPMSNQIHTF
jgi:hypothetical protein